MGFFSWLSNLFSKEKKNKKKAPSSDRNNAEVQQSIQNITNDVPSDKYLNSFVRAENDFAATEATALDPLGGRSFDLGSPVNGINNTLSPGETNSVLRYGEKFEVRYQPLSEQPDDSVFEVTGGTVVVAGKKTEWTPKNKIFLEYATKTAAGFLTFSGENISAEEICFVANDSGVTFFPNETSHIKYTTNDLELMLEIRQQTDDLDTLHPEKITVTNKPIDGIEDPSFDSPNASFGNKPELGDGLTKPVEQGKITSYPSFIMNSGISLVLRPNESGMLEYGLLNINGHVYLSPGNENVYFKTLPIGDVFALPKTNNVLSFVFNNPTYAVHLFSDDFNKEVQAGKELVITVGEQTNQIELNGFEYEFGGLKIKDVSYLLDIEQLTASVAKADLEVGDPTLVLDRYYITGNMQNATISKEGMSVQSMAAEVGFRLGNDADKKLSFGTSLNNVQIFGAGQSTISDYSTEKAKEYALTDGIVFSDISAKGGKTVEGIQASVSGAVKIDTKSEWFDLTSESLNITMEYKRESQPDENAPGGKIITNTFAGNVKGSLTGSLHDGDRQLASLTTGDIGISSTDINLSTLTFDFDLTDVLPGMDVNGSAKVDALKYVYGGSVSFDSIDADLDKFKLTLSKQADAFEMGISTKEKISFTYDKFKPFVFKGKDISADLKYKKGAAAEGNAPAEPGKISSGTFEGSVTGSIEGAVVINGNEILTGEANDFSMNGEGLKINELKFGIDLNKSIKEIEASGEGSFAGFEYTKASGVKYDSMTAKIKSLAVAGKPIISKEITITEGAQSGEGDRTFEVKLNDGDAAELSIGDAKLSATSPSLKIVTGKDKLDLDLSAEEVSFDWGMFSASGKLIRFDFKENAVFESIDATIKAENMPEDLRRYLGSDVKTTVEGFRFEKGKFDYDKINVAMADKLTITDGVELVGVSAEGKKQENGFGIDLKGNVNLSVDTEWFALTSDQLAFEMSYSHNAASQTAAEGQIITDVFTGSITGDVKAEVHNGGKTFATATINNLSVTDKSIKAGSVEASVTLGEVLFNKPINGTATLTDLVYDYTNGFSFGQFSGDINEFSFIMTKGENSFELGVSTKDPIDFVYEDFKPFVIKGTTISAELKYTKNASDASSDPGKITSGTFEGSVTGSVEGAVVINGNQILTGEANDFSMNGDGLKINELKFGIDLNKSIKEIEASGEGSFAGFEYTKASGVKYDSMTAKIKSLAVAGKPIISKEITITEGAQSGEGDRTFEVKLNDGDAAELSIGDAKLSATSPSLKIVTGKDKLDLDLSAEEVSFDWNIFSVKSGLENFNFVDKASFPGLEVTIDTEKLPDTFQKYLSGSVGISVEGFKFENGTFSYDSFTIKTDNEVELLSGIKLSGLVAGGSKDEKGLNVNMSGKASVDVKNDWFTLSGQDISFDMKFNKDAKGDAKAAAGWIAVDGFDGSLKGSLYADVHDGSKVLASANLNDFDITKTGVSIAQADIAVTLGEVINGLKADGSAHIENFVYEKEQGFSFSKFEGNVGAFGFGMEKSGDSYALNLKADLSFTYDKKPFMLEGSDIVANFSYKRSEGKKESDEQGTISAGEFSGGVSGSVKGGVKIGDKPVVVIDAKNIDINKDGLKMDPLEFKVDLSGASDLIDAKGSGQFNELTYNKTNGIKYSSLKATVGPVKIGNKELIKNAVSIEASGNSAEGERTFEFSVPDNTELSIGDATLKASSPKLRATIAENSLDLDLSAQEVGFDWGMFSASGKLDQFDFKGNAVFSELSASLKTEKLPDTFKKYLGDKVTVDVEGFEYSNGKFDYSQITVATENSFTILDCLSVSDLSAKISKGEQGSIGDAEITGKLGYTNGDKNELISGSLTLLFDSNDKYKPHVKNIQDVSVTLPGIGTGKVGAVSDSVDSNSFELQNVTISHKKQEGENAGSIFGRDEPSLFDKLLSYAPEFTLNIKQVTITEGSLKMPEAKDLNLIEVKSFPVSFFDDMITGELAYSQGTFTADMTLSYFYPIERKTTKDAVDKIFKIDLCYPIVPVFVSAYLGGSIMAGFDTETKVSFSVSSSETDDRAKNFLLALDSKLNATVGPRISLGIKAGMGSLSAGVELYAQALLDFAGSINGQAGLKYIPDDSKGVFESFSLDKDATNLAFSLKGGINLDFGVSAGVDVPAVLNMSDKKLHYDYKAFSYNLGTVELSGGIERDPKVDAFVLKKNIAFDRPNQKLDFSKQEKALDDFDKKVGDLRTRLHQLQADLDDAFSKTSKNKKIYGMGEYYEQIRLGPILELQTQLNDILNTSINTLPKINTEIIKIEKMLEDKKLVKHSLKGKAFKQYKDILDKDTASAGQLLYLKKDDSDTVEQWYDKMYDKLKTISRGEEIDKLADLDPLAVLDLLNEMRLESMKDLTSLSCEELFGSSAAKTRPGKVFDYAKELSKDMYTNKGLLTNSFYDSKNQTAIEFGQKNKGTVKNDQSADKVSEQISQSKELLKQSDYNELLKVLSGASASNHKVLEHYETIKKLDEDFEPIKDRLREYEVKRFAADVKLNKLLELKAENTNGVSDKDIEDARAELEEIKSKAKNDIDAAFNNREAYNEAVKKRDEEDEKRKSELLKYAKELDESESKTSTVKSSSSSRKTTVKGRRRSMKILQDQMEFLDLQMKARDKNRDAYLSSHSSASEIKRRDMTEGEALSAHMERRFFVTKLVDRMNGEYIKIQAKNSKKKKKESAGIVQNTMASNLITHMESAKIESQDAKASKGMDKYYQSSLDFDKLAECHSKYTEKLKDFAGIANKSIGLIEKIIRKDCSEFTTKKQSDDTNKMMRHLVSMSSQKNLEKLTLNDTDVQAMQNAQKPTG